MSELALPPGRAPQRIKPVIRFAAVSSMTVFVTFVVWRRTELFFLEWVHEPGRTTLRR